MNIESQKLNKTETRSNKFMEHKDAEKNTNI